VESPGESVEGYVVEHSEREVKILNAFMGYPLSAEKIRVKIQKGNEIELLNA